MMCFPQTSRKHFPNLVDEMQSTGLAAAQPKSDYSWGPSRKEAHAEHDGILNIQGVICVFFLRLI